MSVNDQELNANINQQRRIDHAQQRRVQEWSALGERMETGHQRAEIRRQYDIADFARRQAKKFGMRLPGQGADGYSAAGEDSGGGIIGAITRFFYDEKKDGFQYANMAGGGLGAATGLFMGNYMAGVAGGGWMGATAMVLLTGAGLMFGSRIANEFGGSMMASGKAPAAPAPAKTPEVDTPDEPHKHVSTVNPDQLKGLAAVAGGTSVEAPAALANVPRTGSNTNAIT